MAGFALSVVALAATHRLSTLVCAIAALVALAIAAGQGGGGASPATSAHGARGPRARPRRGLRPLRARPHVRRHPGYRAYLSSKLDLGPLVGDLTVIFTVLAVAALVFAVRWTPRDRALVTLLALLATVVALTYSWLLQIPLHYLRMAYFLPLVLVPIVAMALTRLLRPRTAAAAGLVAALAIGAFSWAQTDNVRGFYSFTNSASLRGLDAVSASLRPAR